MRNKITFEQEQAIIALYATMRSCIKVAKATGHGKNTVNNVLRKHNVNLSQNLFSEEAEAEIVKLYQEGMSLNQLKIKYNCSNWTTIRNVLKRYGIERRKKGNKLREMTYEERQKIIERWKNKESLHAIATELGVARVTLNRWLKQVGEIPTSRHTRGEKHTFWKGGKHITPNGYTYVWVALDDPMYCMAITTG
jgi:DNA invertase Pin-like site-specific DNA recombinase